MRAGSRRRAGPDRPVLADPTALHRRRALRPTEEYRVPTDEEWQQFLGHFQRRKVSTGTCGRAFGTPCIREHACIRCPMLWPDPAQRDNYYHQAAVILNKEVPELYLWSPFNLHAYTARLGGPK